MAKRVQLRGELKWDNSRLKRGLAESEGLVKRSAGKVNGLLGAIGVGVGVAGLVGGLRNIAEQFDRIGKLSTRFDVSAETLQRLGFAAEQSGADMEIIAKAMQRLNQVIHDGSMDAEFRKLGLSVEELKKMDFEEQILAYADAIKGMADQGKASAISMNVLGRQSGELMPFFKQGSESIRAMTKDLHVLSDEGVDSIESFNDSVNKLKTNLAAIVAGPLAKFVDLFFGEYVPPELKTDPDLRWNNNRPETDREAMERARAEKKAQDEKRLIEIMEERARITRQPMVIGGHPTQLPNRSALFGGPVHAAGAMPFGLGPSIMAGAAAAMAGKRGGMRGLEKLGLHRPTFRDAETYSGLDALVNMQKRENAASIKAASADAWVARNKKKDEDNLKTIATNTQRTADVLESL